eukprot:COSAG03_NODE_1751_length_3569_cov_32.238329_1_plen_177_part_00
MAPTLSSSAGVAAWPPIAATRARSSSPALTHPCSPLYSRRSTAANEKSPHSSVVAPITRDTTASARSRCSAAAPPVIPPLASRASAARRPSPARSRACQSALLLFDSLEDLDLFSLDFLASPTSSRSRAAASSRTPSRSCIASLPDPDPDLVVSLVPPPAASLQMALTPSTRRSAS